MTLTRTPTMPEHHWLYRDEQALAAFLATTDAWNFENGWIVVRCSDNPDMNLYLRRDTTPHEGD